MRNKGSKIAMYIERDYKIQQAYERKKRASCKEKECEKCQYERLCEDKEEESYEN